MIRYRARCQTSDTPLSQQQAAAEGVQKIGLNQIKAVEPAWFADDKIKKMCFERLDFLRLVETERGLNGGNVCVYRKFAFDKLPQF